MVDFPFPRLEVVGQPPETFYNDSSSRKKFSVALTLSGTQKNSRRYILNAPTLRYEDGGTVDDNGILVKCQTNPSTIGVNQTLELRFGIKNVSSSASTKAEGEPSCSIAQSGIRMNDTHCNLSLIHI